MYDELIRQITVAQGIVFEWVIQPVIYQLGLMEYAEDVYDGIDFATFGAIEIVLAYLLFRPLELWRPIERWSDKRAVRTDIIYTLVARLGVVPLVLFLALAPIAVLVDSYLVFSGYIGLTLEQMLPSLAGLPFLTLLIYLILLDFAEYWRHRLQHRLSWWWALHSLHHDQRQMTLWTDDRNHILDDVMAQVWRGTIALLIGVPPSQFPLVMILFRLVERLSHSNTRLTFGRYGSLLLNGPQYHRSHHALEHAQAPFDGVRGCNFAVILPVWDVLFRTWRPEAAFPMTGIDSESATVSRSGYLRHQLDGFRRLGRALLGYLGRTPEGASAAGSVR